MIKKVYRILKSIILSAFFLYGYNIIAAPLDLIVPINVFTICLVSLFGVPAIFGLVVVLLFSL